MTTGKTRSLALLSVVFALLACKQGAEEAKAVEEIQARACACKDKACTRAAFDDYKTVLRKIADARASQENFARVKSATTEATKCFIQRGVTREELLAAADAK